MIEGMAEQGDAAAVSAMGAADGGAPWEDMEDATMEDDTDAQAPEPMEDAGTDAGGPEPDGGALVDAGTDAGQDAGPACDGEDLDGNELADECEECPTGGCLPVLWTFKTSNSPYDIVGSIASLELVHPETGAQIAVVTGPESPDDDVRRSHIITTGGFLQAVNDTYGAADELADVYGHFTGLRTPPAEDYNVTVETAAMAGGASYLKLTQQTNDWRFKTMWTLHGP